jgi:hypothetical protein
MADYKLYAFYVASKIGKTSLTPTVDVYNSGGTAVVTAGTATEIGGGIYRYTHTSATAEDYIAIFKTTDATVDAQHIPSLVSQQQPLLDAAITTRLAGTAYVTPTGAGTISWTYTLVDGSALPIPDADIWITSDIAGAVLLASSQTSASGEVTFNLDAGTIYVWGQKSGYNFTNPDTEVVV